MDIGSGVVRGLAAASLFIAAFCVPSHAQVPQVTSFDYDVHGNLVSVVDPTLGSASAGYDILGRLTDLETAVGVWNGLTYQYDYDTRGRLVALKQVDGAGWLTSSITYTQADQVETTTDPDGHTSSHTYDLRGWQATSTDPAGRVTAFRYRPTGEIDCVRRAVGTSLEQAYQRLDISAWGSVAGYVPAKGADAGCNVTNAAYRTGVGFDAFGRGVRTTYPDGSYTLQVLDARSQPVSIRTRDGVVHTYEYLAAQGQLSRRLRQKAGGGTPDEFTYSYNAAGEQVSASLTRGDGSVHTLGFEHDVHGRLSAERRPLGLDTEYLYDRAGRRTGIVWPDGWTARYVYDEAGRLRHVWADPDGIAPCASAPDACGSAMVGNGDETRLANYIYEGRSRLFRTEYGASQSYVSYSHRDSGILASETHTFSGEEVSFYYGHDPSGKLVFSGASEAGWLYTPDVSGTEAYGAANTLDQYASAGGSALSYDANGNLVQVGAGLAYGHNSDNQLVSAGGAISYRYDALGRRVSKTVGGVTTHYVHAGDQEIAEADASGQVIVRYVPGPGTDQRIAMVTAGNTVHYYHADRLGHVIAMASSVGVKTDQYVYTPFGVQAPLVTTGNPFRFTGQRFDPETGLYYYKARYYDPRLGRFLQTDPVGYADQMNLYAYVHNDPLNATDPTGEATIKIEGAIGASIGKFVQKKLGIKNPKGSGGTVSVGVAVSFPFFDGAKFDAGVMGGLSVEDPGNGGTNIIGEVPGVSGALVAGANSGSVEDLRGQTLQGSVDVPLPKDLGKGAAKKLAKLLPKGQLRDGANKVIDSVGDSISGHAGLTADMNGNVTGGEIGLGAGANMEAAVQKTVVCTIRTGCN